MYIRYKWYISTQLFGYSSDIVLYNKCIAHEVSISYNYVKKEPSM